MKQTVPYPKNSYDVKMASERANYCEKTLIASAQKHLDEQKRSDKGKEEIFLNFETQRLKLEEEELAKQVRNFFFSFIFFFFIHSFNFLSKK